MVWDYEKSRGIQVIGTGQSNGMLKYFIKMRDSKEPIVVSSAEGKYWAHLIFKFLLKKIDYLAAPANAEFVQPSSNGFLTEAPTDETPEVICKFYFKLDQNKQLSWLYCTQSAIDSR